MRTPQTTSQPRRQRQQPAGERHANGSSAGGSAAAPTVPDTQLVEHRDNSTGQAGAAPAALTALPPGPPPNDASPDDILGGRSPAPAAEPSEPDEVDTAQPTRFLPLQGARLRAAFAAIDALDAETVLSHPCSSVRSPPHFLKGTLRKACHGGVGSERAWKLWLLLPRLLLFRPAGGAPVPKQDFLARFDAFFRGEWQLLVNVSGSFPDENQTGPAEAPPRSHSPRVPADDATRRAERAVRLARLGELSSARQALLSEPLAPGDAATLQQLTDPRSRPDQAYQPIAPDLLAWNPDSPAELLPDQFFANLRRSRKGAAPGPSGLTGEILRLVLDDDESSHVLWRVAARLARADAPTAVGGWLGIGRLVAVQKPSGGVRGLVVGDFLRRLVSRTLAQQFADHFDAACRPYQYALSTRSGTEALVHTLQVLTETSPTATVLSVDGVGAYDHVSRQAMLEALRDVPGACRLLPYVRMWYASPSTYVWHDSVGQPHHVLQAEGGEQGDPLMPALFALAMHQALVALQPELRPEERSLAFSDDLHLAAQPDRIQPLFQAASRCLYERARISLNHAKTRVWNAAAVEPPGLADISAADVWRGSAPRGRARDYRSRSPFGRKCIRARPARRSAQQTTSPPAGPPDPS